MTKNNFAPSPIPKLSEYPYLEAIAATDQDFGSGRLAIKKGQLCILEFGPTQITVHDPARISPCEINKLGCILYSYVFSSWEKEITLKTAQQDGRVSEDMYFLLLKFNIRIVDKKAVVTECLACGKQWKLHLPEADQKAHLKMHKDICG